MFKEELQEALELVLKTEALHPGATIRYNDGKVKASYEYTVEGYEEEDFSF